MKEDQFALAQQPRMAICRRMKKVTCPSFSESLVSGDSLECSFTECLHSDAVGTTWVVGRVPDPTC